MLILEEWMAVKVLHKKHPEMSLREIGRLARGSLPDTDRQRFCFHNPCIRQELQDKCPLRLSGSTLRVQSNKITSGPSLEQGEG